MFHWIEELFGAGLDGGSGLAELTIMLAAFAAVACYFLVRARRRKPSK
jgi:hypothetical protein